jgi:hypothetical protein
MNRSIPPRAMSGARERSDLVIEIGGVGGPAVASGVDTAVSFEDVGAFCGFPLSV